jgi:protein involved in polysaccharide export with SLBB domain
VVGQATLSGVQTVGADGTILITDVGTVVLGGATVQEAAARIEQRFANILQSPQVSVIVVTRMIEVTLLGEVRTPGKYPLQSGDGVASAIALAGGLTEYANSSAIYLVRQGEPLRIRFRMRDLLKGGESARAFALRDGDILLVD